MTTPGEALAKKKVALVGLRREVLLDATAALDAAGATWQASGTADASALRQADLVVAGVDAAAQIDEGIPLLVVGSLDEVVRSRVSAGQRDFLIAPPLQADELLLRGSHLVTSAPPRPRVARDEKPVILAADDDPTTTTIVRAVVTQKGMTCHIASDGRAAIESAKRIRPDVVVLDVNMPFHDGFEVLAAIRQAAETEDAAVVMLTSVQQEADVVRAFSLGADDYVVKPFNPMELLARIERLVKKEP